MADWPNVYRGSREHEPGSDLGDDRMPQPSQQRSLPRWLLLLAGLSAAVALAIFASLGTLAGASQAQETGEARNVILFIGDGLGAAQRDAIQLATVGPYERLAMDSLPYEGMVGTNSVDPETFVTDSATSMASGVKTVNGAVGLDADGNVVPTVLERLKGLNPDNPRGLSKVTETW